jgi:hypothetical protein
MPVPSRRAPALLWVWFASALLFVTAWTLVHRGPYRDSSIIDTPVYQSYGDQIVAGRIPYADFDLEYPPGALPVFALPSLGHDGPPEDGVRETYSTRFELEMLFCGFLLLGAAAFSLRAVDAGLLRSSVALGAIALAPLLLGPMILSRFDYWPAAVTGVTMALAVSGRRRWAAVALGAAIAIKVYPAALVPLLVLDAWRTRGRREAVVCAGLVVGTTLVLYVPFLFASPSGVWDSVHKQTGRPLQVETLGSALLIAGHHLFGLGVSVTNGFGSQNLSSRFSGIAAKLTTLAELGALVAVWIAFGRTKDDRREALLRYGAAAVVAFVAFGKVLSPQFMIWLVPLVALVGGRRGLLAGGLLAVALWLTLYWFPGRYWQFVDDLKPGLTTIVLLRDLLLVAVVGVLLRPVRRPRLEAPRTP